jgi:cation diffusion facilitator CzcD-associated flavoprotein CzcO
VNRFPHIPGVKDYEYAVIRKNSAIDTPVLCHYIKLSLEKQANAKLVFGVDVQKFNFDAKNKSKAVSMELTSGETIDFDKVVLCPGPFSI